MNVNRSLRSSSPAPHEETGPVVALLKALGTFGGASEDDLKVVVEAGQVVTVPAGWSLIWDRTPADKAYVILDGEVEVHHDGAHLATLGSGDLIGEVAILRHRLRSATVTAVSPLTVLHLSREALERLYVAVPAVHAALDRSAVAHSGPVEG